MTEAMETREKVLCLSRACLPPSWLREVATFKMSAERFQETMEGIPGIWMPRHVVETDRAYKQLIPYVVLQTLDGLCTACYRRNGAEARLHSLWSVGIGGHINEEDGMAGSSLAEIVERGMERELREEFQVLPVDPRPVFHGIINEERTPVGHVHLGLVFRLLVSERGAFRPGRELDAFAWLHDEALSERPLELWSRLALNLFESEEG